ncbi:MAG: cysteinyl-tRNA synthetase [Anaerolineae bacterium]|nr:cysteinyl-tRNA synthetase [Anaerolineae bacterium]
MTEHPGRLVFIGSGETSPSGQKVFDRVFAPPGTPVRVAILETPAGFELNSDRVAGRVAEFLVHHLQNYRPQVTVIPARRRGTPHSPDDSALAALIPGADAIYLGAGSPTYAVRQLEGSRVWHTALAAHRLGATLILASAAVVAAGAHALPVYEIYKVGHDVHWHRGLDLLGAYGLRLALVPHWNNRDGGDELDTSHCYMGRARFERLARLLPGGVVIAGIDEHTALFVDLGDGTCQVIGAGGVTVVREGREHRFEASAQFPISLLGEFRQPAPEDGLPDGLLGQVCSAAAKSTAPRLSPELLALQAERDEARARHDWATADALRARLASMGWQVLDTPEGALLQPVREDS